MKWVKCYLKTEKSCLKTQTKHPLNQWKKIYEKPLNFDKHYFQILLENERGFLEMEGELKIEPLNIIKGRAH